MLPLAIDGSCPSVRKLVLKVGDSSQRGWVIVSYCRSMATWHWHWQSVVHAIFLWFVQLYAHDCLGEATLRRACECKMRNPMLTPPCWHTLPQRGSDHLLLGEGPEVNVLLGLHVRARCNWSSLGRSCGSSCMNRPLPRITSDLLHVKQGWPTIQSHRGCCRETEQDRVSAGEYHCNRLLSLWPAT